MIAGLGIALILIICFLTLPAAIIIPLILTDKDRALRKAARKRRSMPRPEAAPRPVAAPPAPRRTRPAPDYLPRWTTTRRVVTAREHAQWQDEFDRAA